MTRRWPTLAVVVPLLLVSACGDGSDDRATGRGVTSGSPPAVETRPIPSERPAPADDGAPEVGTQPATLDAIPPPAANPPTRIEVAALGVDARVTPVGVAPDGSMEVPAASDVGWYRFGPVPGGAGSAVLAAHVDLDGREGAFFRLRDLRVGDEVVVTVADGARRRFVVDAVTQVPKPELGRTDSFAREGPSRLALITCGGEFDVDERSYRDNVVVTAVPAG